MFLVLLRTTLDDMPLRLFPAYDIAREWALALDPEVQFKRCQEAGFMSDRAEPCYVSVVTFEDGESTKIDMIRDLWDEEDGAPVGSAEATN